MTDPRTELWDQPRIAREFGVNPNTVQSGWRPNTLKAVRAHLAAHGYTETDTGPAATLTAATWQAFADEHALAALTLPHSALPLPDVVVGTKPAWTAATINSWADSTRRRTGSGGLRKAPPPGRPAGVTETRPRAPRTGRPASSSGNRFARQPGSGYRVHPSGVEIRPDPLGGFRVMTPAAHPSGGVTHVQIAHHGRISEALPRAVAEAARLDAGGRRADWGPADPQGGGA